MPHSQYSLHPSALLATAIAANEYLKQQMTPLVLDHVKRALDEEERTNRNNSLLAGGDEDLYLSAFGDPSLKDEEEGEYPDIKMEDDDAEEIETEGIRPTSLGTVSGDVAPS